MTLNNTVQDYLKTIEAESSGITCPAIYWYLNVLRDMNQQSTLNRQLVNQKNTQDASIDEGLIRVMFILAMILGHRSKEANFFLEDIFISKDVPFTLPRKTVVSPKYLQKILCSEPVLGNPKIGFSQNLLQKLRQELKPTQEITNNKDILVPSNRSRGDDSFAGLRSLGGTSVTLLDGTSNSSSTNGNGYSRVREQKEIGRWISDRTLYYLGNIGNALSEDTAKPIKDSLKGTLEIGLIATLHHEFGQEKVYLLPVSAQGKDSESLDLGEPLNQKLSEYVFILPVVLSVNDTQPVTTV
jgi:hypothetical protein